MRTRRSRSPRASSKKSIVFIQKPSLWCCRAGIGSKGGGLSLPLLDALLNDSDGPEVVRQVVVGQIGVGDGEVSAHAPTRSPGIAHQEPRGSIVVARRHHGVPAQRGLRSARHGYDARLRHAVAFKAFVDRESEHKWIPGGEASLHLI